MSQYTTVYTQRMPDGKSYTIRGRPGMSRRQVVEGIREQNPEAGLRTYTVRANDGNVYSIQGRPGQSQTAVRNAVHEAVPEADVRRNPLGAGFARARNNLTTGVPYAIDTALGRTTPEEDQAYRASQRRAAELAERRLPGGAPTIDQLLRGQVSPLGFLAENLGQSAPQMGAAIAGGLGGAALGTAVAPGPGTLAGGVGGVLGGAGASTPFFVGSNVDRATEDGQTSLTRDAAGRALAAAPLQAAADVVATKFIPGLNRVFGGPVNHTALARLARPGLARGAVRVGQGAVAGGAAEAGQQFGERYAAGLPLGDSEALREYGESAAVGAIMDASIGAVGAPFSGRRDGAPAPAATPSPGVPTATPPNASTPGVPPSAAPSTATAIAALAPNQRVVFNAEFTQILGEGLVSSEETAAEMALQVASNVPPIRATKGKGAANVVPVGQPSAGGVSSADPRGGVVGVAGPVEGPAAGNVVGVGQPAALDVQGEGNVDAPLAEPVVRPRGRKAAAPAVAPAVTPSAVESETLAPVATAAAELAAPVRQAKPPRVAPPPAPTPPPEVAIMRGIEEAAAVELPEGPVRNAFLLGASAKLFEGPKGVEAAIRGAPKELRPVVQQGAAFASTVPAPPAAPVTEAPAAPVTEAPAAPVVETPAAPAVEAPVAPVRAKAQVKKTDAQLIAEFEAAAKVRQEKAASLTPEEGLQAYDADELKFADLTPPQRAAWAERDNARQLESLRKTEPGITAEELQRRKAAGMKQLRSVLEVGKAPEAKGRGKRSSAAAATENALPVGRVQSIASRVVAGWKNAPPVVVVATSTDVPSNTEQTLLKGQYDGKSIYVVADTHKDAADVQATVYHESLVHAGLRQELGRKLYAILDAAIKSNPQMAAAADKWLADNPEAYTQYNERTRRAIALEEVLADTPVAAIKKVPAMARVWARLRDAFRSVGRLFGAKLSYNDADIQALLQRARDNIVSGGLNRANEFSAEETRDARAKKSTATAAPAAKAKAAKAIKKSKAVVSKAQAAFDATNVVRNPGSAANANYAAGNMADHMPMLKDMLSTLSTPAFKQWLRVMPLSSMAEWGDKNVPGLMELYHTGTKKIGQLHTYQRRFNEITKQLVTLANKSGQEAVAKVAYATRLNRVDVNDLKDTLDASYNADKPMQWIAKGLADKNITQTQRGRLRRAREIRMEEIKFVFTAWQELGKQKGGREAFLATQKFYKTMYNALKALNYSAMRRLNVSAKTQADLEAAVDRALEGEVTEDTLVPNDQYPREYTPAKRFGEFWLDIAADTSKGSKRKRVFATFDTAGQRDAALRELVREYGLDAETGNDALGTRVVFVGNSMKELQDDINARGTMLKQLFDTLDEVKTAGDTLPDAKQIEALKDKLFRTWLMSGAANSLQKNFIETKELVAGFSEDLTRVFADSAMQYASLLTSAEYDNKVESQIEKLRADIKEQKTPREQARYRMFVDEMENRLVQDYEAENGPNMFNSVNRAMFFYFLTAPATAAAQWVSLPGVVVPFLGAEYGYAQTTAAFAKNLDFAKVLGANETNALGEKVFSLPSMRHSDKFRKDPLFRKAYLAGAARAVFETMVDVVTSSAATPAKQNIKLLAKTDAVVTGVLSAVYTSAELVTREVAFMTAFDLHYAKTKNFDASVDAAVLNVNKSMGSYLDIERPAFMKSAAIRSLTAFKQYSIAMTKLYMDLVAKIATGKGERLVAAKQLAGITAMGALLGGVPGTMVFGIIGSTAGAAMKAMFDEEEKEAIRAEDPLVNPLDNFEAWFRRKWLPETYGTGMGDIIENGVISELTGADFASRLSNSNMWFRDGKPGETPSQDILNTAAANIPPLSMAMSVADATKDFSEGKVLRGVSKIVPAFLRGGVNAILLNKQGVESPTTGDTSIQPEELNMADIIAQTVGFVPMKVSDFRKESFAFQGARTEAGRAKTRVMGNLYRAMADENAEPDAVQNAYNAIERHNMRYPTAPYFIDNKTLQRSLERQMSSDERTYRGMLLNEDDARFAPVYEGDR